MAIVSTAEAGLKAAARATILQLRTPSLNIRELEGEAIRQRFGLAEEEAVRWVEKTDAERVRFVKDHFQKDPTDARHYDLVLNSSRFTVAECADLILEALRRLQAQAPARRAEPVKV